MAAATPFRTLLLGTEVTFDATAKAAPTYLVTGVTTGQSIPIDCHAHGILTIYLRSLGTTSGGTVLIEEADWGPYEQPYSGTWSQVQSIAASTFTGGQQIAIHISDAAYAWLRVRISSTITGGGTMTAALVSRGAA
jgi:hypothetical protein